MMPLWLCNKHHTDDTAVLGLLWDLATSSDLPTAGYMTLVNGKGLLWPG